MARQITQQHIDSLSDGNVVLSRLVESAGAHLYGRFDESQVKSAVNHVLQQFVTGQGYRVQIAREHVVGDAAKSTGLPSDEINGIVGKLVDSGILKVIAPDFLTISDNNLARRIKAKLDTELRILRDAGHLLTERFLAYSNYKVADMLLSEKEIELINPYIHLIDATSDERDYLERSKRAQKKQSQRKIFILSGVVIVLLSLLIAAIAGFSYAMKSAKALSIAYAEADSLNHVLYQKNKETDSLYVNEQHISDQLQQARDALLVQNKELSRKNAQNDSLLVVIRQANATLTSSNDQLSMANALLLAKSDSIGRQRDSISRQRDSLEYLSDSLWTLSQRNIVLKNIAITQNVAREAEGMDVSQSSLKAALASTAYHYNVASPSGTPDHPAIYSSLYKGARDLSTPDDFNVVTTPGGAGVTRSVLVVPEINGLLVGTSQGMISLCTMDSWDAIAGPGFGQCDVIMERGIPVSGMYTNGEHVIVNYLGNDMDVFAVKSGEGEAVRFEKRATSRKELIALFQSGSRTIEVTRSDVFLRAEGSSADMHAVAENLGRVMCADYVEGSDILVLGLNNGEVLVLDVSDGSVNSLRTRRSSVTAVNYLDLNTGRLYDGHLAVGYEDGTIEVWYVAGPRALHVKAQTRLRPNDNFVALSNSGTHSARINQIELSPDKRFVAAAGYDGRVSIWDVEASIDAQTKSYLPVILDDHSGWISGMSFSPDSEKLLVVQSDGELLNYSLSTEPYAARICSELSSRNEVADSVITQRDWELYFGSTIEREKICD